jgi:peptidoglycan/LPS O-acetylase OafA/YrhL
MSDPVAGMDPRIDRLRGLLAIGVLLGHAIDLARISAADPSGTLFSAAMATRPFYGFICVVGFIALSGYCIARSTLRRFALGEYIVKRVTRVYPLLIVATLLTGLLEWVALDNPHRPFMWILHGDGRDVKMFIAAMLGFSGFKRPFGALSPAYTISFELFYYAIWGLAMKVAAGRGRRALLLAAAVALVLMIFGDRVRESLGWFADFVPIMGIAVFSAWLLGAALAVAERPMTRIARVIPTWATWLVLVCLFAYGVDAYNLPTDIQTHPYVAFAYFAVISGLFLTVVATWLAHPDPAPRASDIWLGEMSYPLFLMHGPAIIAVQFALNAAGVRLTFAANLAVLLAAAFVAAMLMLTLVERPVMAWRRSFRLRPRTAPPALAETAAS